MERGVDRGFAGDAGEAFRNSIPPSETSKTITFDPTTDSFIFFVFIPLF